MAREKGSSKSENSSGEWVGSDTIGRTRMREIERKRAKDVGSERKKLASEKGELGMVDEGGRRARARG